MIDFYSWVEFFQCVYFGLSFVFWLNLQDHQESARLVKHSTIVLNKLNRLLPLFTEYFCYVTNLRY